jgi:hypothetical protein
MPCLVPYLVMKFLPRTLLSWRYTGRRRPGTPALSLDGRGARPARRDRQFPRLVDLGGCAITINGTEYRARDLRGTDQPSFTVTEKARSSLRWPRTVGWTQSPSPSPPRRPPPSSPSPRTTRGRGARTTATRQSVDYSVFSDERTGLVLEPLRWVRATLDNDRPYEWLAFKVGSGRPTGLGVHGRDLPARGIPSDRQALRRAVRRAPDSVVQLPTIAFCAVASSDRSRPRSATRGTRQSSYCGSVADHPATTGYPRLYRTPVIGSRTSAAWLLCA